MLWPIILFGAGAGVYITHRFKRSVLIELTAGVGAYAMVRGIGAFAGGFPNELEIMSGYVEKDSAFYAYLAEIIALTIGGTLFQFHRGYDKYANVEVGEEFKAV